MKLDESTKEFMNRLDHGDVGKWAERNMGLTNDVKDDIFIHMCRKPHRVFFLLKYTWLLGIWYAYTHYPALRKLWGPYKPPSSR